jgi:hypothetical protein
MRETGLDAEAPASELDGITAENVWWLARRLYQWLASPARKLPAGATLAQLAGDGLAGYKDDADACLSTFAVRAGPASRPWGACGLGWRATGTACVPATRRSLP